MANTKFEASPQAPSFVEVMARAMFSNETAARCTIERLEAAGFAVVPVDPTPAMTQAGAAKSDATDMRTEYGYAISIDEITDVWLAMVGARVRHER